MCIWSTIIYLYIWKMLWTYHYFSFESVHGEAMLKMRWVVKKWIFSFWKAINWSKCILMVSIYIWLSIYTNNAILCIIWKFDLSSRGVLGRIYALSIEVLRSLLSWATRENICLFPSATIANIAFYLKMICFWGCFFFFFFFLFCFVCLFSFTSLVH